MQDHDHESPELARPTVDAVGSEDQPRVEGSPPPETGAPLAVAEQAGAERAGAERARAERAGAKRTRKPPVVSTPSPAPMAAASPPGDSASARVVWVSLFLMGVVLMRYAVPYMCEEVSHSIARGRQRAEYEVATQYLQQVSFDSLSKAYQMVSQRVVPSVVHINVDRPAGESRGDEHSFLFGSSRRSQDQGSGVILDEGGFIVTNAHVVEGGARIHVYLSDGRHVTGALVGTDMLTDLAVIKIDADKLIAAEWGDSDELQVGALVWAAGSPFGLQSSITQGILSAKNRAGFAGTMHQDFLQTDAAVNPGNSGGPLVDSHGRVVGINTAILGDSYQGISFAVPSTIAQDVYSRLRREGHVERGYLGVEMAPIDEDMQDRFGLDAAEGVLVVSTVGPDSPAYLAGIEAGDVITHFDAAKVLDPTQLARRVAATTVGTAVQVTVLRRGLPLELRVEIGRRPNVAQ